MALRDSPARLAGRLRPSGHCGTPEQKRLLQESARPVPDTPTARHSARRPPPLTLRGRGSSPVTLKTCRRVTSRFLSLYLRCFLVASGRRLRATLPAPSPSTSSSSPSPSSSSSLSSSSSSSSPSSSSSLPPSCWRRPGRGDREFAAAAVSGALRDRFHHHVDAGSPPAPGGEADLGVGLGPALLERGFYPSPPRACLRKSLETLTARHGTAGLTSQGALAPRCEAVARCHLWDESIARRMNLRL